MDGSLGDGERVLFYIYREYALRHPTDRHPTVAINAVCLSVVHADVTAISAGWYYSMALMTDGTVWVMGRNKYGQFGDGTTTSSNVLKLIGVVPCCK